MTWNKTEGKRSLHDEDEWDLAITWIQQQLLMDNDFGLDLLDMPREEADEILQRSGIPLNYYRALPPPEPGDDQLHAMLRWLAIGE